MRLHWFGHACFLIESSSGQSLVTDPYNAKIGYDLPEFSPDLVTVSHNHFDHNAVDVLGGSPQVISGVGRWQLGDFRISGMSSYHDERQGTERGTNTVFIIEVDGLRIAHLGDLGHQPDQELARQLAGVDVLLVPVGGTYTIDAGAAGKLRGMLQPRLTIPMHYFTPKLSFPLASAEEFLQAEQGTHLKQAAIELHQGHLPAPGTVWALSYSPKA